MLPRVNSGSCGSWVELSYRRSPILGASRNATARTWNRWNHFDKHATSNGNHERSWFLMKWLEKPMKRSNHPATAVISIDIIDFQVISWRVRVCVACAGSLAGPTTSAKTLSRNWLPQRLRNRRTDKKCGKMFKTLFKKYAKNAQNKRLSSKLSNQSDDNKNYSQTALKEIEEMLFITFNHLHAPSGIFWENPAEQHHLSSTAMLVLDLN